MRTDDDKHPDYYRLTLQKAIDGLSWQPEAASPLENPEATSALNHSADREG